MMAATVRKAWLSANPQVSASSIAHVERWVVEDEVVVVSGKAVVARRGRAL
jgi:hypothetical protein